MPQNAQLYQFDWVARDSRNQYVTLQACPRDRKLKSDGDPI